MIEAITQFLAQSEHQKIIHGVGRDLYYLAIIVWLIGLMGLVIEASKDKPKRERMGDAIGFSTFIGGSWFGLSQLLGSNQAVWSWLANLI